MGYLADAMVTLKNVKASAREKRELRAFKCVLARSSPSGP